MLRTYRSIRDHKIGAKDDDLGSVHDLFFDDHEWTVRYLVADTGDWLPGRRVLIAPNAIEGADWENHRVHVNLTVEQVENSPPIDEHQPISREAESHLVNYYAWPMWWGPLSGIGHPVVMHPPAVEQGVEDQARERVPGERENLKEDRHDPHLQSMKDVKGYDIHAHDGEIGEVHDFIFEEDTWKIRYLVVDTHKWLPGKKVLIAPDWIHGVRWEETEVNVDMTRDQIKNSPEYDPSAPINREFEGQLYDYYGRPKYWE